MNKKVAAPVQKTEINGRGDPLRLPRDTLYPQKSALTSPTGGGRSVCIVRSRNKATEFFFTFIVLYFIVTYTTGMPKLKKKQRLFPYTALTDSFI